MIKFTHIVKEYIAGDVINTVLHDVSFEIKEGELVGIMGPSGAGKSTIMNIIGLLDVPSRGEYYLNDKLVSQLGDSALSGIRSRDIGFIFQAFFLLPNLTIAQNVALPLMYQGVGASERNKRALEMLNRIGISHLAHRRPSEMSGGQQQRAAIARALVANPPVILADEPTGALDTKTGQEILELLMHFQQKYKKTVVIVTHDVEIGKQCERIIYIKDGRIEPAPKELQK